MILQDYKCSKCKHTEHDHVWLSANEVKHTISCEKCGADAHIKYGRTRDYRIGCRAGRKVFDSPRKKAKWLAEKNLMDGSDLVGGSRHFIPAGMDEPASIPHGTLQFDHMPTAKDFEPHTAALMQRLQQGDRSYHTKETLGS